MVLFQMSVPLAAILLRVLLSLSMHDHLVNRPEISTPVNSIKRVKECIALKNEGLSPYAGETCHENPILIVLIQFMMDYCQNYMPFIYAVFDVITGYLLAFAAYKYVGFTKLSDLQMLRRDKKDMDCILKEYKDIFISDSSHSKVFRSVQLCYLFNPYSILSCAALTTSTMDNMLVALVLYLMVSVRTEYGNAFFPALLVLSFLSITSFYPVLLMSPLLLTILITNHVDIFDVVKIYSQASTRDTISKFQMTSCYKILSGATKIIPLCCWFCGFSLAWLYFSTRLVPNDGMLHVLDATVGFSLKVPELTPNCGLFWYFFTEMFDHFNLFFLWVFQANIFVYILPLTICYRKDPFLLFLQLLMLISVFKSYPCVGDASLYLALLPAVSHLFRYIRHSLVVGVALVCCTILAPVMWSLWLYSGSANANFYFAITLLYSTCHIFLLTDVLYAYLRREVHMKFGGAKPMINGKVAKIILK